MSAAHSNFDVKFISKFKFAADIVNFKTKNQKRVLRQILN